MASGITAETADWYLDYLLVSGIFTLLVPSDGVHAVLCSADPGFAADGTSLAPQTIGEPVPVASWSAGSSDPGSPLFSAKQNSNQVSFVALPGGTATHVALIDTPVVGPVTKVVWRLELDQPVVIPAGRSFTIPSRGLSVEPDPPGGIGDSLTSQYQTLLAAAVVGQFDGTNNPAAFTGPRELSLQTTRATGTSIESSGTVGNKPTAPYADAVIVFGAPVNGESTNVNECVFTVASGATLRYVQVLGQQVGTVGPPPTLVDRSLLYSEIPDGPLVTNGVTTITFPAGSVLAKLA